MEINLLMRVFRGQQITQPSKIKSFKIIQKRDQKVISWLGTLIFHLINMFELFKA